jgi:hypothetical protein
MTSSGLKTQKRKKSEIEEEIQKYLEVIPRASSSKEDPLEWWRVNQSELPLLAELARKHLCIPVCCSGSECMENLGSEHAEKLIYIRENGRK